MVGRFIAVCSSGFVPGLGLRYFGVAKPKQIASSGVCAGAGLHRIVLGHMSVAISSPGFQYMCMSHIWLKEWLGRC